MPPRTAALEASSDTNYEITHPDYATRIGDFALATVVDVAPEHESRESRSATQTADFLWRVFRRQPNTEITPTQAAFALEQIEDLYQVTKTEEQVQERIREKLALHFAGYTDTEIVIIYDMSCTKREIAISRAAIIESLQNDYSQEVLDAAFELISSTSHDYSIEDIAAEAVTNIENLHISNRGTELVGVVQDNGNDLEWQQHALCAQTDPEAFYPEAGGSTRKAKKVCLSCDVRTDCLKYALDNDERFGIWGGLSERERRSLKKQVQ